MFKGLACLKTSAAALAIGVALVASSAAEAGKVRIAFGDIASVESLHLLSAFERAKEKGVGDVCFDRGGFKFHGRVKALADAAREAGLKF